MSEMIMIKTKAEEDLMFQLLKEFATKVVTGRRFIATDTFNNYKKQGIYGVIEVVTEQPNGHKLFELALPAPFAGYIQYEVDKLRDFLTSVKQQNGSIQK